MAVDEIPAVGVGPRKQSVTVPIVVSIDWLGSNNRCVVADVRWSLAAGPQRDDFERGHLPNALFIDLDHDLADHANRPATDGRHPLPTAEAFADTLGRLGIGPTDMVVAYDATGGSTASRFVWMLRAIGQPAALLDGGLNAFDGPLETGPGRRPTATNVPVRPWPDAVQVTADDISGVITSGRGIVLDARAADRYRGDNEPVDPRPGHIPGARNAPWAENLGATGHLKSADELRRHYAALGVEHDVPIVVSCGSGVTACSDAVALAHAGFTDIRLFVPSWSGWCADPTRTAATGPEPS
jgi:thiosulfate/3-mercaptopyruvate sulfurtransferase